MAAISTPAYSAEPYNSGPRESSAVTVVTDDYGIITEVSGEAVTYMGHLVSTNATYFGIYLENRILPVDIIEGENDEVYIRGLVSNTPFSSYVKGERTDEGIVIPFPQNVGTLYGEDGMPIVYCANIAGLTQIRNEYDEIVDTYMNVGEDGPHEVLFRITDGENFTMELNDTPIDVESGELPRYIIGVMDSPEPGIISWAGPGEAFADWDVFKEKATVMPETAETTDWAYRSEYQYGFCKVGFDGDDVYVAGLCTLFPDACLKGTLKDGKVTFPMPQFIGIRDNAEFIYYYGEGKEEYQYFFIPEYVMDYDSEKRSLTPAAPDTQISTAIRLAQEGATINSRFDAYPGLDLIHQPDSYADGNPMTPIVEYYDVYDAYYTGGCFNLCMPPFTTDGYLLNPENLYYNIYINDEPYTLTPEDYPSLEEPMTDIPYTYTDTMYINVIDAFHQVYVNNIVIKKFGIQLNCRSNDGTVYSSEMLSFETPLSSVESVGEDVEADYYTLDGIRVANPTKGIYVRKTKKSDGATYVSKIFIH